MISVNIYTAGTFTIILRIYDVHNFATDLTTSEQLFFHLQLLDVDYSDLQCGLERKVCQICSMYKVKELRQSCVSDNAFCKKSSCSVSSHVERIINDEVVSFAKRHFNQRNIKWSTLLPMLSDTLCRYCSEVRSINRKRDCKRRHCQSRL